jgi:hypothetical protein
MAKPDPKMTVARCALCGELTIVAGGRGACATFTCRNTHLVSVVTVPVPRTGVEKALREAQ